MPINIKNGNSISATTISATTFYGDGSNLTGISAGSYLTGVTYSNNVLTFTTNSATTSNVVINTMTGLTVNGNVTVTGTSALNGTITSTGLANTGTTRMVEASSGGTVSATKDIISGYISDSTAITNITTAGNWTINGSYTGTSITGTYQGQNYYDDNYLYTFVADNTPIRLIRG